MKRKENVNLISQNATKNSQTLTTALSENTVAKSGQRLPGFITQVKCLVG